MKQLDTLHLAQVIADFDDNDESLPLEMLVTIHDELKRLHSVNQELLEIAQTLVHDGLSSSLVRKAVAAIAKAGAA